MHLVIKIRVGALESQIFPVTHFGFMAAMDLWDNLMAKGEGDIELLIEDEDGPVLRPKIRLKVGADGRGTVSTAAAGRLRFGHSVRLPRGRLFP